MKQPTKKTTHTKNYSQFLFCNGGYNKLYLFFSLCFSLFANNYAFAQKVTANPKPLDCSYCFTPEQQQASFDNLIKETPLIIRGNLLYGDNWKKQKDEISENVLRKGFEDAGNVFTHKYLQINEVLRGDTTLKGKIIELVLHTGYFDRTGIINSSHARVTLPNLNDRYQEYFFLKKSNFKNLLTNIKNTPFEFTVNSASVGNFDESHKDYNFNEFSINEASLFNGIIDSKNYNPKFMLEAGMKIPEAEKKAVGFSVVEIEEPNNLKLLPANDLTVKIINKQNTNNNQFLEFDIQVKAASTTYAQQLKFRFAYSLQAFNQNISSTGTELEITPISPNIPTTTYNGSTFNTYQYSKFNVVGNNAAFDILQSINSAIANTTAAANRTLINTTYKTILHVKMKYKTSPCLNSNYVNWLPLSSNSNFYTTANNVAANTSALNAYNVLYDALGYPRMASVAPVITSITTTSMPGGVPTCRAGFGDTLTINGTGLTNNSTTTCGKLQIFYRDCDIYKTTQGFPNYFANKDTIDIIEISDTKLKVIVNTKLHDMQGLENAVAATGRIKVFNGEAISNESPQVLNITSSAINKVIPNYETTFPHKYPLRYTNKQCTKGERFQLHTSLSSTTDANIIKVRNLVIASINKWKNHLGIPCTIKNGYTNDYTNDSICIIRMTNDVPSNAYAVTTYGNLVLAKDVNTMRNYWISRNISISINKNIFDINGFYLDTVGNNNGKPYLYRTIQHELGHFFGLDHCKDIDTTNSAIRQLMNPGPPLTNNLVQLNTPSSSAALASTQIKNLSTPITWQPAQVYPSSSSFGIGNINSNPTKPVITTQPISKSTCLSGTGGASSTAYSFSIAATNATWYDWQRNISGNWQTMYSSSSNTFNNNNCSAFCPTQAGSYTLRCVVYNSTGCETISKNFVLTIVNCNTSVIYLDEVQNLSCGSNVNFKVYYSQLNFSSPQTLQVFKNNVLVGTASNVSNGYGFINCVASFPNQSAIHNIALTIKAGSISSNTYTGSLCCICENSSQRLIQPNNIAESEAINIYPNPAHTLLNIILPIAIDEKYGTIDILNISGQSIQRIAATSAKLSINTENLKNGLYWLRYTQGNKIITQKFTVQH